VILLACKPLLCLACRDRLAGGVQECLHMEPNLETVYLRKRLGFVRLALQHGAHLVILMRSFLSRLLPKRAWYVACSKCMELTDLLLCAYL